MHLSEVIHNYLCHLDYERALAKRTVEGYRQELRLFERVVGGDPPAEELQREQVLMFLNRPTADGRLLKPSSRNHKLIVLRGMFNYLEDHRFIRDNPTDGVPWARVPRTPPATITWSQFKSLLQTLDGEGSWMLVRDRAIVQTLYGTGVRVSELTQLRHDQVNLEGAVITGLRRKGGSQQSLPLNSLVVTGLRDWIDVRMGRKPKTDRLFLSRNGGGLSVRQVERRLSKLGKNAGISVPVTPHMLRHLHATELVHRNVNLEVVKKLMNHQSITTTSRYLHVGFESLQEAVARLAEDLD